MSPTVVEGAKGESDNHIQGISASIAEVWIDRTATANGELNQSDLPLMEVKTCMLYAAEVFPCTSIFLGNLSAMLLSMHHQTAFPALTRLVHVIGRRPLCNAIFVFRTLN